MSEGLKIGLVLGGVGLVGFLLYEHFHAAAVAAGVPTVPGTGSALAAAPGTGSTASAPHTSITSSVSSLAAKGIAFGVTTPIRAVSFAGSVVKDVGSDIYSGLKSLF